MKKPTYLIVFVIALQMMSCQEKPSQNSVDSLAVQADSLMGDSTSVGLENQLIVGSETPQKVVCHDSCDITYQNCTIFTKPNQDGIGDAIVVVYNNAQQEVISDDNAQYFYGKLGNYLFLDIGTGNVRAIAIYDWVQNKMLTTIDGILGDAKIIDNKLIYSQLMADDAVKSLNLSPCSNPDLEVSGYTEELYYDLETQKVISTKKYKCVQ